MANTKIKHRQSLISAESLAMGAAAESLATAGATIPANAGEIWVYVPTADNAHWQPVGTPTSSVGHAVAGGNWIVLQSHQQGSLIISDDAGDMTVEIVYWRGSDRPDNKRSLSAPL